MIKNVRMDMLTARPQSKFTDKDGFVDLVTLLNNPDAKDYPEVGEWDRQYAAECDHLAASLAAKHRCHCGRWYLDQGFLCTPVYRAPIGDIPGGCHEVYDFSLDRCRTEKSRQLWIEHMAEKNWMGEKGIADLKRAFNGLTKELTANTAPWSG
jgi:hypothetical protein